MKNTTTELYIPNISDLENEGKIGENEYLFYDYKRDNYIHIASGEREVLPTSGAKNLLQEVFTRANVQIKASKVLEYTKKVRVVFDIEKSKQWQTPLGLYYNEFQEELTKFSVIKEIRSNAQTLYNTFEELKQQVPVIAALLKNLHEDDEQAVMHFINWFSCFMHTKQKPHTAFMFSSIEGAGKGVLTDRVLRYFFSSKYQVSLLASTLKSHFNSVLENKLLVNFNEVSSDFHKTDVATQTLKSLITDNEFTLNVKNQREVVVKNNFLVILSQNNLSGVKISTSDRRFNYFVPKRTLKRVAEEDFNLDIDTFINKIDEELDTFVQYIALYNYNLKTQNKLYETESKMRAVLATSNPSDYLFEQVKNVKIDEIEKDCFDLLDAYNNATDKYKYSDEYTALMHNISELLRDIREDFKKGFISNVNLTNLYKILVAGGKDIEDRYIKKVLDSNFEKSEKRYTSAKKSERVRLLDKKLNDIEF